MTFSVAMAVEDFVPVIFGGLAFFWLGESLAVGHDRARRLSRLGAMLLTVGGTSKATWKLVLALTDGQRDLVLLDEALFFLLACGFICLGAAFLGARIPGSVPERVAVPLSLAVATSALLMLVRGEGAYRVVLIVTISIASSTALVAAALEARRRGALGAAALVSLYLIATFALQALGRKERSVAQQWAAQLTNTAGTLCLLAASIMMRRQQGVAGGEVSSSRRADPP